MNIRISLVGCWGRRVQEGDSFPRWFAADYIQSIEVRECNTAQYRDLIERPWLDEEMISANPLVALVDGAGELPGPGSLPILVLERTDAALGAVRDPGQGRHSDAIVPNAELDRALTLVERAPISTIALAMLLRSQPGRSVTEGLVAESAVYSTLQGGPEFDAWLHTFKPRRPRPEPDELVLLDRRGDELSIVLNRRRQHNALSNGLRDALAEALKLAHIDGSIASVALSGNGASFCTGGDLTEFGGRSDPATAHLWRLTRSPARLIAELPCASHAYIHGPTLGSGIELSAFCDRVIADPQTRIGLPELTLGLIPGAGGTVSLTRRIGRHRTMLLTLCDRSITAREALEWGLIDEIGAIGATAAA